MTTLPSIPVVTPDFSFLQQMPISCGRTLNRLIRTLTTLSQAPGASIAAASADEAEARAIYRLLQNPILTENDLTEAFRQETLNQMKETGESVFLCVQDTTEVSYAKREKTPGLGECRGKHSKGLLLHSALALTPSGLPIGLLHQKIWTRDPSLKGERKVERPYEEKESYKWTEAAQASVESLPEGLKLIHIGDREADFFEFLSQLEQEGQSYVVRAVQNRMTKDEQRRVWDEVRQQPEAGQISVSIPRDSRKGTPRRETTLALRFRTDTVRVPNHLKRKGGYTPLPCTVIQVLEQTPLPGEDPLEWLLWTNLPLTTAEEAAEKVAWYVQRWKIERFHYILKSGCEVEKLQAREADRLRKLLLMYSMIAVRLQHLTYAAREWPEAPCTEVMEEEEWQVLYRVARQTRKLPKQPPTLNEVVRDLAKLGGFLGRKSDGEPGAKVIWKGMQALRTVLDSYRFLV